MCPETAAEPTGVDPHRNGDLLDRGVHRMPAGLLGFSRPVAVVVSSDHDIIATRIIRPQDSPEQVADELQYMLASADPVPS